MKGLFYEITNYHLDCDSFIQLSAARRYFAKLVEISQEEGYFTEREMLIIVVLWPLCLVSSILYWVVVFSFQFGQNLADKFWAILTSKNRKKL